MARTSHQNIRKVKSKKKQRGKVAKISNLKQAGSRGQAPVIDPKSAPLGFTGVPVSITTLVPGQGPPMSSTPSSGQRGAVSNRKARKGRKTRRSTAK